MTEAKSQCHYSADYSTPTLQKQTRCRLNAGHGDVCQFNPLEAKSEAPERIWIAPVAFLARSASAVIYDESCREPSDIEYRRVRSVSPDTAVPNVSELGAFWQAWFEAVGAHATIDVIHATTKLVLAEREIHARDHADTAEIANQNCREDRGKKQRGSATSSK